MNDKKIKLSRIIFAGVIIIVSFFYAINIQPVVIGESGCFKTYDELNNFNSYNKLADFLKNKSYFFYYLNFTSEARFALVIPKGIISNNKIILFGLSNFKNPKEVSKIVIGNRGIDSSIFYDHKAFLFDKEKELLVFPINLYEISDDMIKLNRLNDLNEINYMKLE